MLAQGATAIVAATGLATGYGVIVLAAHGPMRAGDPGAAHATAIHASSFTAGVLLCSGLATVIAAIIARRATRPAGTFTQLAVALTVVSLVAPLAATHTTEATRLLLGVAHLIAAAIVIPILRRGLTPCITTPRAA